MTDILGAFLRLYEAAIEMRPYTMQRWCYPQEEKFLEVLAEVEKVVDGGAGLPTTDQP
jgi:hypothetical protein